MSEMKQGQVSLFFFNLLLVWLWLPSSNATLLPFIDSPPGGSLLTDFWPADPFRILEHIPFAVERDDNVALSPARVDWKETPESHIILLDVPGLNKDEVKIELMENRVLRVSGERKKEKEQKGEHWHRVERSYGKFWRQFKLPDNVELDTAKAKLENGVLSLSFDKLSPDKIKGPRVVSIAGGEPQQAKLTNVNDVKQEL